MRFVDDTSTTSGDNDSLLGIEGGKQKNEQRERKSGEQRRCDRASALDCTPVPEVTLERPDCLLARWLADILSFYFFGLGRGFFPWVGRLAIFGPPKSGRFPPAPWPDDGRGGPPLPPRLELPDLVISISHL